MTFEVRVANRPAAGQVPVWDGRRWVAQEPPRQQVERLHTSTVVRVVMGGYRSPDFVAGSAGWALLGDGSLEANDVTARGTMYAEAGEVGGWTISAAALRSGSDVGLDADGKAIWIHSEAFGEQGVQLQFNAGTPRAYIGDGSAHYLQFDGAVLTVNGAVVTGLAEGSDIGILGWQFTGVFSATDADTVAWTSGTLSFLNGDSYAIVAGNTGNMAALTYIYFDKGISETVLQTTTTASTAVGANKVLVCVAENTTTEARIQVFGGTGGLNINADNIAGNSITANEVAANTITATELNVATLSAIAADMGTLTAGEIRMYTGTWDNNATGFRVNATEIAGQNVGTDQVVILASTGKLTAGGGNVVLDEDGISIFSGNADVNKLTYHTTTGATYTTGEVYSGSAELVGVYYGAVLFAAYSSNGSETATASLTTTTAGKPGGAHLYLGQKLWVAGDTFLDDDARVGGGLYVGATNVNPVAGSITAYGGGINIGGAAVTTRLLRYYTGTSLRWQVGANTAAESGGNVGSDFNVYRYTDAGAYLGNPLRIMRSNGRVSLGNVASPLGQLHVDQPSTIAAIPVLYLDQGDDSEPILQIQSAVGAGLAVEAVGSKVLTTTHFIKIKVSGGATRYIEAGTIA